MRRSESGRTQGNKGWKSAAPRAVQHDRFARETSCNYGLVLKLTDELVWARCLHRPISVAHDPLLLIIDDSAELRGAVKELLSSSGIRVIEAGDGYDGVRKAYQCHPDLIVMDIDLPGMDGCEATRLLKRQAATRDIPVVGLTGQAFLIDEARAKKRGFVKFLSKASDPAQLLEEIESALGAAA
jgi:CheY-like chemotaxis protein